MLWLESKRTVLFITHNVDEATDLSDTIYIINQRPVEIIEKINVEKVGKEKIKNILTAI